MRNASNLAADIVIGRPRGFFAGFVVVALIAICVVEPTSATGLTWRVQLVDGTYNAGRHSSIAIAANRTVYVLYQADDGGSLRLATQYQNAWTYKDVAGPGYFQGDTSLALDSQGNLHISFYDAIAQHVRYGTRSGTGGNWNLTDVDTGYAEGYNRMILDRYDAAHITYSQYNGSLWYARLSGSVWIREPVDPSTILARYETIALDWNGRPHIAYYGNGQLRFASKPSVTWNVETPDPREYVGWYPALGYDSVGRPHIAYYDSVQGSLRYATESLAGTWSLSLVDATGDSGLGISLAIGKDDEPRIAYYARIPADLRLAEPANGSWEIQTVDDEGVVGWDPGLAIDSTGVPHVSYYDWTQGALRYAVGLSVLGTRTLAAIDIAPTDALLRGEISSLGSYSSANASFRWRAVGDLNWTNTTVQSLASATVFSIRVDGLTPGATYEFEAVVEAGGATETGRPLPFSTIVPTAPNLALILLAVGALAIAGAGTALVLYIWFRGPALLKRRDGMRRDGRA